MQVPKDICVIVPTYNNGGTVKDVVSRVLEQCQAVIVVSDGSTDNTLEELEGLPVTLVSYPLNRGKGGALKRGFEVARELGFKRAITIDSDGQHYPEDLPLFIEASEKNPGAMIIGSRNLRSDNMPGGNTFANKFSNFWFALQTGVRLPDTQTGYRLYQLDSLGDMIFLTARYEAELELLVGQCWKGVKMVPVKIRVYYPPEGERVTHFRPFLDFARISVLNTILCIFALFYGYPSKILRKITGK